MSQFNASLFWINPDEELLCGICMNVLDKPLETPCRHVFCTDCIHAAIREQSKCPLCRKKCTKSMLKEVLPLVQNLLNKLKMKCKNYDNGCVVPIKMEYYHDHLTKCDFAMINCQYKECSAQMLRKDMREHEKSICFYRNILCERGCGLMLEKSKTDNHDCVTALVSLVKDLKEENASMQKTLGDLKVKLSVLQNEMVPPPPDSDESEISSLASSIFWDINTSDSSDSDTLSTANSEHLSFNYHDDSNSDQAVEVAPRTSSSVAGRSDSAATNPILDGLVSELENSLNASVSTEDSSLYNANLYATDPSLDFSLSPIRIKRSLKGLRKKKMNKKFRPSLLCSSDHEEGSSTSGNDSGNKMSFKGPDLAITRRHKPFLSEDKDNDEGPSTSSFVSGNTKNPFRNQKSKNTTSAAGYAGVMKSKGPGKGLSWKSSAIDADSLDNETHSDDVTSTLEEPRPIDRPMTRSLARICNRQVSGDDKFNLIPNVKVPPSAAYLLDKYTVEDSSEDEMWLPPESMK